MTASPAIFVRGVTKTYGTGALALDALRGVDLEVARGELVMLAGPSGSGKTTLLSIVGCILRPTSGEVRLFDDVVSRYGEERLPHLRLAYIGFVFQGGNLIASLTALDNVSLVLEMRGQARRRARRDAADLLARVGLADKLDSLPSNLSGGQRQRVAVARAVAGAPPIVLADEPTASLDAESGLAATQLLREMAHEREHAVVVVTHDARIFSLADRVIRIDDGLIVGAQA